MEKDWARARSRNSDHSSSVHPSASMVIPCSSTHLNGVSLVLNPFSDHSGGASDLPIGAVDWV